MWLLSFAFWLWFYGVAAFAIARVLSSSAKHRLSDKELESFTFPVTQCDEDLIVMLTPLFNYVAAFLLMVVAFTGFKKVALKGLANKLKSYMD
jgi:hypothetical protein